MASETLQPAAEPTAPNLFLTVFPSIMLPMFLAALDQTIVATALPSIAGSLGDVQRVSWVVIAYLVANTIAAPVYGRLGDAVGRKRMMFLALGVFVAGSALCALSTSILLLTASRLLQGAGGGGLMTLSQALIAEAVPPRQRGKYQGYLSGMYATAATFGPVAGGWLTQAFGWQSVFLVNLPLGLLAALLVMRLPAHPGRGASLRFDIWGTVFFAGFIAPLLLAMEQAQHLDRRVLPAVAGLLALAVASVAMLLRQERRAAEPLLPIQLFRQAGIWRTDLLSAVVAAQTVSLVAFLPMYLQVVRGAGTAQSGLLLLPLTLGVSLGSLFCGRVIAATGRTAIMPSIGLVVSATMLLSLAAFAPRLGDTAVIAMLGVAAACTGTVMPVVQMTVQVVAGPRFLGAAAASVQFSRSVGASIGTALVGAVLFAMLAAADPHTAAMFAGLVQEGPRALAALPEAQRLAVRGEIADAFRAAFLTIGCFTTGGMLLAWWLPVRRI
ncbi:MFS transporter [Rhodopila globiformis]|uniref:MFS transporter n=1 Tax=Rhodopila globiformis TaxID=1071 RepID=A0A2S6MUX8_RHOGL|nr:MFS transporter [Rhodopila globiformis]PPQ26164.1 MFS transporter [Rhodopila globiformis]